MDTISKRLKDTLRNAMQDGGTYSNEAIRQLILGKTGMKYGVDYKESHFAGCLSALKRSGEIIQVQRGEYIKGKSVTRPQDMLSSGALAQKTSGSAVDRTISISQAKEEILQSVQRELVMMKSVTQNIVLPFDTPAEDIQCMLKLKELIKNLEEFERQMGV